jgi:hypothetical protein
MSVCPACAGTLQERQRWCLNCGASALARIATAPRWARVAVAVSVLAAIALAGIGFALVTLAG